MRNICRVRDTVCTGDPENAIFLTFNTGFIFDADDEDEGLVEDASSYMFVGPTVRATTGTKTSLLVDLLIGQSEVLTDVELFSKSWSRKEMLRFRPRIRFILTQGKFFKDNPTMIGMWSDLGIADTTGDTYVVFVARTFGASKKKDGE